MLQLIKYDEMIKDTNNLSAEYEMLSKFKVPSLANLTIDLLNEYGSKTKLNNANKIGTLIMFMLKEKNLINDNVQQSFVDLLIASCLLHNIKTVSEKNWNEVYKIRDLIAKAKEEYPVIPDQAIETICDTIEGQLGEKMPIKGSRPNPNTPGELFALAVAITNRYNK